MLRFGLISLSASAGCQLSTWSLAVGWAGGHSWVDSAFQVLSGAQWPRAREMGGTGEKETSNHFTQHKSWEGKRGLKVPGALTTAVTPAVTAENQSQASTSCLPQTSNRGTGLLWSSLCASSREKKSCSLDRSNASGHTRSF